jgi:integrase
VACGFSWLLKQSKADQKAVQELMAHTDEKTTGHYQNDHEEQWVTMGLKGAEIG